MEWSEVENKEQIFLNLGGGTNCHPNPLYQNYISVDLDPPDSGWTIKHDLRKPIPLPENSVQIIHSEDFVEHLEKEKRHRLFITSLVFDLYKV